RLDAELLATGARQFIVLGAPVVVRRAPLGTDPAVALEPVQGGVERPLRDLERGAGHVVQSLRDRPAVLRAERERFEDQEVERPLGEIQMVVHRRPWRESLCASTGVYRQSCRSTRGA